MRAVVVYRADGLGSRLMAFGNGLRMARVLGVPCYWTWNERSSVGGVSDLGQLLNVRRIAPNVRVLSLFRALKEIGPARIYYDGARGVVDRGAVAGSDVLLCGLSQIQRLSGEVDSPGLREDFAAAIRCIVPVPMLVDRARNFSAEHDLRAASRTALAISTLFSTLSPFWRTTRGITLLAAANRLNALGPATMN